MLLTVAYWFLCIQPLYTQQTNPSKACQNGNLVSSKVKEQNTINHCKSHGNIAQNVINIYFGTTQKSMTLAIIVNQFSPVILNVIHREFHKFLIKRSLTYVQYSFV